MPYENIAISGLPGSGKNTLIKALSQKLPWKVHSIGDLFRRKYLEWKQENLSRKLITFEEYWDAHVTEEDNYKINEDARRLLISGGYILDSRFAAVNAHNLPKITLLVFVKSPLKIRAQRNRERYQELKISGIEKLLKERQEDEIRTGKRLYPFFLGEEFDYTDEKHYDLVLDTSVLNVEQEVAQIQEKLQL